MITFNICIWSICFSTIKTVAKLLCKIEITIDFSEHLLAWKSSLSFKYSKFEWWIFFQISPSYSYDHCRQFTLWHIFFGHLCAITLNHVFPSEVHIYNILYFVLVPVPSLGKSTSYILKWKFPDPPMKFLKNWGCAPGAFPPSLLDPPLVLLLNLKIGCLQLVYSKTCCDCNSFCQKITNPRGIQQLVSTYSNCHWRGEGGCSGKGHIWTQERKLELWNWGGGSGKSKPKVPRSG